MAGLNTRKLWLRSARRLLAATQHEGGEVSSVLGLGTSAAEVADAMIEGCGLDHRVGHPTPFEPSPLPAAEDEGSRGDVDCLRITANIARGFCPKKRSAAVVPSGRVSRKLWTAVRHSRFLGWSSPRS